MLFHFSHLPKLVSYNLRQLHPERICLGFLFSVNKIKPLSAVYAKMCVIIQNKATLNHTRRLQLWLVSRFHQPDNGGPSPQEGVGVGESLPCPLWSVRTLGRVNSRLRLGVR